MPKRNIWTESKKPLYILAPMEDVTDTVFRRIVADCGRPDIFFTEFTSCEGICSPGFDEVVHRFAYTEQERPLIAQIWGKTPDDYRETAKLVLKKGFDGVDINFGCPVPKIVKQGCCSALIEQPELAVEIIKAVQDGVQGEIPVSVKTRIGFSDIRTLEWSKVLLEQNLAALTMHGRTARDMSKVPADWGEIGKVVKLRDDMGIDTLIIGNGDVLSLDEADQKIEEYGVDGVMIGRGIFQNPWLFDRTIDCDQIPVDEKLELLLKHTRLFVDVWGTSKNFAVMKKFFKIYVSGFQGASDIRYELMQTDGIEEVEAIVSRVLKDEHSRP